MSHSSTSCYGTKSGKPLTEYLNEHDAKSGAAYVLERFGSSMFPYQCDKCGLWHLSPIDRNTSHSSTCYGKISGKPLTQYDCYYKAMCAAAYVSEEHGKEMDPYQCEQCGLWHLSPIDRNVSHSSSCYGKISGKALTQYDCYYKAMCAAAYVSEEHGKEMVSYKCERCQLWHLTPIERQTEHTNWSCMCKDENGQSKDCYKSKEDAQRRAQILKKEMGANLYVYQCPETDKDYFDCIWHLTKKEPQQFTASRKSTTCTTKQGTYRMEYDTKEEALRGAVHARERHGNELSAYLCSLCDKWHIGSSATSNAGGSFIGRKSTSCTSKHGTYRMEYDTEEEALDGVNYTWERYAREVSAYLCSTCDKWHIG